MGRRFSAAIHELTSSEFSDIVYRDPSILYKVDGVFRAIGGIPFPSIPGVNEVYGPAFGIVPDTGRDLSDLLEAALRAARIKGVPLILEPGGYIYSRALSQCGGGLVCHTGEAWLDSQSPTYSNHVIDFQSTDSSYLDGIEIRGIKFTCSTRPDIGLSNGADEYAHFVRVTKARNVKIWGNKFGHNFGGAVLFRDVEDSSIIGNEATDIWKDGFHVTDSCRNITRAFNIVRGAGDDAFAVVGYVSKGVMPIGIADISNRVYGCRKGRAFAYVGCKDVYNSGCYVDGRIPDVVPQKADASGGKYNSACALYIAAESGGAPTFGNENITVIGFVGEYIGPSIDNAGNPVSGVGSLQQIHINAGNGASNLLKNIKIQATLRNGATRGMIAVGSTYIQDLDVDLIVDDNTDPLGILSLTSTPGLGTKNAVELQGVRNVKLKLRANKIGSGAVYADAACSGKYDLDVSVGSLCQTIGTAQSAIQIVNNTNIEEIDFKLNFETSPTTALPGLLNRIIDNPTQGITRSCSVTGVNHAPSAGNILSGWPTRTVTLGSSPSTVLNYTGRPMLFYSRLGTVSSIGRASVKGRSTASAVTTGANGTVTIPGDFTDIYVASAVVTLFNGRGISIATATVASSAVSGGSTVVTFDATGVNASFAIGMQMAVVSAMKTMPNRTNGVIELPQEMAVQVTYTASPTCAITDASF